MKLHGPFDRQDEVSDIDELDEEEDLQDKGNTSQDDASSNQKFPSNLLFTNRASHSSP